MAGKTFHTTFEVGGKYTAGPTFNKAQHDLHATEAAAKATSAGFGKMFGAFVTGIMASHAAMKAWHEVTHIFKESFEAAIDLTKAEDRLKLSVERLVGKGVIHANQVGRQVEAYKHLAEKQEEVGFAYKTNLIIFAEMGKYFRPGEINKSIAGVTDWMTLISKGAPSAEKATALLAGLNKYIKTGRTLALQQLGVTKEQLKGFKEGGSEEERKLLVLGKLSKSTGEYARWSKTLAGVEYEKNKEMERVHELMGEGTIEPYKRYQEIWAKIYKTLKPVAEAFSKELEPALDRFNTTIEEHQADVVKFFERLGKALIWIIDHWKEVVIGLSAILAVIISYYAISAITALVTGLGAALLFLISPMGIVTLALLALGAAILFVYENWDTLGPIAMKAWEDIKTAWEPVGKWFADIWENIKNGATAAWKGITEMWDQAVAYFQSLIDELKALFDSVYFIIYDPFWRAWNAIVKLFTPLGEFFKTITGGGGGALLQPGSSGARQSGDYVPEWSASGTGGTEGAASNPGLAEARAKLLEEVKDPRVRAQLYARVKGEVGNQGPGAIHKEMETIFNRAYLRGQTIAETAAEGGKAGHYWGSRYKAVGAKEAAVYDLALGGIRAGSDKSNLATGNESAGVRNGRVVATAPGGERFVIEPADVAKHKKLQDAYQKGIKMQKGPADADTAPGGVKYQGKGITPAPAGASLRDAIKPINMKGRSEGSAPTNVTMNPIINVHGVPTGQEGAVGQEVVRAMQDPTRNLLTQIKAARAHEARLGYV